MNNSTASNSSSSSRTRERSTSTGAFHPSQYRRGVDGRVIRYAVVECVLGWTIAAATEEGLCAVLFDDGPDGLPEALRKRFPNAKLVPTHPEESAVIGKAVAGIREPARGADVPLDIKGTAFRRRVWDALRQIPPGETRTYGEIASSLGEVNAARAVAGACAANTIAYYIPCHRVVPASGGTGGYRWGVERKRLLLEAERRGHGTKKEEKDQ